MSLLIPFPFFIVFFSLLLSIISSFHGLYSILNPNLVVVPYFLSMFDYYSFSSSEDKLWKHFYFSRMKVNPLILASIQYGSYLGPNNDVKFIRIGIGPLRCFGFNIVGTLGCINFLWLNRTLYSLKDCFRMCIKQVLSTVYSTFCWCEFFYFDWRQSPYWCFFWEWFSSCRFLTVTSVIVIWMFSFVGRFNNSFINIFVFLNPLNLEQRMPCNIPTQSERLGCSTA